MVHSIFKLMLSVICAAALAGCSGGLGNSVGSLGGSLGGGSSAGSAGSSAGGGGTAPQASANADEERETIWDLFDRPDRNTDYRVNRYLWNASLDVLGFLPVESADPFSGLINMGYGRAPGSSQAFRATIRITEAALDARALSVDIQTRSGPASVETQRQIENAILTRARQLVIQDKNL